MGIGKTIKKCLVSACIYFTVIVAGYMLILQVTNIDDGVAAVEAPRVLLYFLFSLMLSAANFIRAIPKINGALGYAIHYVICVFAFYTCFMLPVNMRGSFMVTGVIIFTLLYVIFMALIAFFKARLRTNRAIEDKYTKQFKR